MDIEAVKKRLEQLQSSNKRTTNLWKPPAGDSQIRILPNKLNSKLPFIELYFHYDLGRKNYLSPISFKRPDPIEEFASKLKSTGSRDDWQLGRKLEAKMRTFAPVIVRGEEQDGVKFWGFGKTVYQALLGFMADASYGDISDPVSGRDITVTFHTAKELKATYPQTTIRPAGVPSVLSDNPDIVKKLIESQKDISELYQELSYDDLADALEEYLNPTETSDDEESVDSNASTTMNSEIESAGDASDAFEKLFEEDN